MRMRVMFAAIFAAAGLSLAADFAIFPPRSTIQCVIDGKAISEFPTVAALGEKFGDQAALAGRAVSSQLAEKISFYAFAALPLPPEAVPDPAGVDDEEEDDDWEMVTFVSFAEKMTVDGLRDGIVAMAKGGPAGVAGLECTSVEVDGGFRMTIAGEDTESFFVAMANDTLAVIAPREGAMRESVAAVRDGSAVCPDVGAGNPLAWLSATVDPDDIFDDDESRGGMEFLAELNKLAVVADGNASDGSIALSVTGMFATPASAGAASGMLSALLQMAAFSQDASNPLIALGKRARIEVAGSQCRIRAEFSKGDIESFFGMIAAQSK